MKDKKKHHYKNEKVMQLMQERCWDENGKTGQNAKTKS